MSQLEFAPDELIVDNFAGGGGASVGIEWAIGRSPDIAINHDQKALAMHRINHPDTLHLCEDVWAVDIKRVVAGRRVGLAWFSPDCKHFSKAKGGKPVEKKIRGLAWVALRWAGLVRPRVIVLENVEEFQQWGPVLADGQPCKRRAGMTFKRWCTQLRNLGYNVEFREERASWYGAPTIRKRLFIVARNDGKPIVWPAHTHGKGKTPYRTAAECIDWSIPCPSIFLSKEEGRAVGCNRPLADATMERIAKGVYKYVLNNADPFIVNLTHHGSDRNESLREPFRTVTGAKRGEKALVSPIVARVAHGERDKNGKKRGQGTHSPAEPLGTVTASPEFAVIAPHLLQMAHGGRDEAADAPMRTIATEKRGSRAVIAPFLAGVGGRMGQTDARGVNTPYHTTTAKADTVLAAPILVGAGGPRYSGKPKGVDTPMGSQTTENHRALTLAFMSKMRGTNIGHGMDEPLHTMSAGGTHFAEVTARLVEAEPGEWPESAYLVAAFLMKYYGTDQDPQLGEPLHSVTTKDRFAVVIVTIRGTDYVIVDIGMRMLTPRELFRAQGFPDSYIIERGVRVQGQGDTADLFATEIELTRTEQIRMCGNSVSPYPAAAIIRAQFTPNQMGAVA